MAAGTRDPAAHGVKTKQRQVEEKLLKSSALANYNDVRGDAIPLTRAANTDTFLKYFRCGDPGES